MKHIDSKELLARTKILVAQERRTTIQLIEHLQEIERRMYYAKLGYGSLWEFATQELGLSEGAAQRRIQAMRLLRDVPQAKESLRSGKLSLSNAAKVQSFRQAQKRQGQATDAPLLIAKVESLSQRECEKILFEISPQALPQERERLVSAKGDRELKLVVSVDLHDKLMRLKSLLSHAIPEATYAQLLEYLVDQTLPRLEKKKGILQTVERATLQPHCTSPAGGTHDVGSPHLAQDGSTSPAREASSIQHDLFSPNEPRSLDLASAMQTYVNGALAKIQNAAAAVEATRALPAGKRVYLPVTIKRAVWARGNGQCEIIVDGRRCLSHMRLEIDHVTPLALGGTNCLSNLRLACWHHNQQQAREKLSGTT